MNLILPKINNRYYYGLLFTLVKTLCGFTVQINKLYTQCQENKYIQTDFSNNDIF